MSIQTKPLTPHFGADVQGIDLNTVTANHLFPQIRALFEEHSALLFRAQDMTDETHLRLAGLFGPIEDREADERKPGEGFKIPKVSNVQEDGTTSGEMDLKTLNLKTNFLWHSDSTFLPTPALINIITARVVPSSGGATELASTRAAWAMMPEEMKARIRGRGIWHRYSHSRRKISPELAELPMFNKWPDTHWNAVWENPINGREALYIASHAFKVDGYDEAESEALLAELTEFCTQPAFVYAHNWQVGDVLIWDQRAVMHRGTPWPYEEPRTLSSICATVTEEDGLDRIRVPA
ncbi:alpha-ketoglutarate-dependent 2,4-dichlorophenoxyacetate dioxygenase [Mameliella alba]|uniref:TauD/TfdA dioxygenase family protein n=1 Tax=Mameliella alba TaxID=561184 RepID=UPI0008815A86|nr:TauD/TfdA family dioxygenase [Mameliella alba]OWV46523.1 TauD/TfdA family dioxygenase [Mameliella alba]PTR37339.1 alpha-ketoglutarate-dependent 2,4-dichlorophenoxyacetate dioxygenase [Mameliella alba]GGF73979.1 alpha-ketoglutarate-dependent 2,4-dichlorophenoxyacetate dioxygenase [Mameliella alba]SDD75148.1 alpha-ketoglutarate-dependent 2,4-dichlorophenoxyacetate dioxygenase [Mameliella alba]